MIFKNFCDLRTRLQILGDARAQIAVSSVSFSPLPRLVRRFSCSQFLWRNGGFPGLSAVRRGLLTHQEPNRDCPFMSCFGTHDSFYGMV